MHDILDLYEESYDPKRPLIALDEKSKLLLKNSRETIFTKLGGLEKYMHEKKKD
jgi:hypothetical protein